MRFLPHAHRISLLSPAPVSHIFHSCRPSMPRKQKAASVPTPIKQSHKAMVVSYRPQTLHDTIHTVLPGEVLPAIPSYSEFIAVRLFVFQLTASRRDWRRSTPRQPTSAAFQLTASRRGWRNEHVRRSWAKRISTHSLTKRLTRKLQQSVSSLSHFNSQPHEEADQEQVPLQETVCISTHSLTKRLTTAKQASRTSCSYFNSQPHEEADGKRWSNMWRQTHFNSQPHEEADGPGTSDYMTFSIFQLTASRRGWLDTFLLVRRIIYFNSQPHEEADGPGTSDYMTFSIFQLTASRRGWHGLITSQERSDHISTHSLTKRLTRGRPGSSPDVIISTHSLTKRLTRKRKWNWESKRYFNSQPHEEADGLCISKMQRSIVISTHSLTKRLTILPRFGWWNQAISTHSLTKRLTIPSLETLLPGYYFNSQPHEEADDDWGSWIYASHHFNSQPHEEADGFFQHQS